VTELRFYTGPMSSGKSTLALQTAYNLEQAGKYIWVMTMHDRKSGGITSRLGFERESTTIGDEFRILKHYANMRHRPDALVCDEVQFYSPKQIEELAYIADHGQSDVYAYGLKVNFKGELFPGTRRLIELADRVIDLQLENFCWCGEKATQNARTVDGVMVTEGEEVVVGDTDESEVAYVLLCRRHFMDRKVKRD